MVVFSFVSKTYFHGKIKCPMDKQQDQCTLTVIKYAHDERQAFVQADLLMSTNTCKSCVIVENVSTAQLIATNKNELNR